MKKIFKSNIVLVIITMVICMFGTVYAQEYLAKDVSYDPNDENWNVADVETALNDLYISSNTFKNLSSITTVAPDNLISGITAYNNQGQIVTGSATPNCITGKYMWTQTDADRATAGIPYQLLNYIPSLFIIITTATDGHKSLHYYNPSYNSDKIFNGGNPSTGRFYAGTGLTDTNVHINKGSNTVTLHWGDSRVGHYIYFMACR